MMKVPGTSIDGDGRSRDRSLKENLARMLLEPLDILTGKGYLSSTLSLPYPVGRDSCLVVSSMDKVGELDPGEVSHGLLNGDYSAHV